MHQLSILLAKGFNWMYILVDLSMTKLMLSLIAAAVVLSAAFCGNGSFNRADTAVGDTVAIHKGQSIFERKCASCHNFKQDAIGPQLSGITGRVSGDWLQRFIRNPKSVIESGDSHAMELLQKYHAVMPSFDSLDDDQLGELVSFLATKQAVLTAVDDDPNAVHNPVPGKIEMSELVLTLDSFIRMPASSHVLPRTRINKLDYEPSTGDLFVMDLRGILYRLEHGMTVPYLNMSKKIKAFINEPGLGTGLGSFAFHPNYAHNGLLYTAHTEPAHAGKPDFFYEDTIRSTVQWVITEWKAASPGNRSFTGTSRELFRLDMVEGMHGVQELAFNPTAKPGSSDYGMLYIGVGDGASAENGYPFLAADRSRIWGKILRIDPLGINSLNGKYGIPADNPFSGKDRREVLPEIFAFGFRNPNRINWSSDGKMFATNIGHSNIESLYQVFAGSDQGWPFREGNFEIRVHGNMNNIFNLPVDDANFHYNYPIALYDHDEGKAIAGGYAYEGRSILALKDRYVFGDIVSGRLFYIDAKEAKPGVPATVLEWRVSYHGSVTNLHDLCNNDRVDLRFGHDKSGELYILTKSDGMIYQLKP